MSTGLGPDGDDDGPEGRPLDDTGLAGDSDGSKGKKAKKKKKGKKSASAAVPMGRVIDLSALPPRERAIQAELLTLAETMGVRVPPPPPPAPPNPNDPPPPPAPVDADGDAKAKKKGKKGKKDKKDTGGPKPLAPNAYTLAQVTHIDPPVCTCADGLLPKAFGPAGSAALFSTQARSYKPRACPVHGGFEAPHHRITEPFESELTPAAARLRIAATAAPTLDDVTATVHKTVLPRERIHAMIERYTEVRPDCVCVPVYVLF